MFIQIKTGIDRTPDPRSGLGLLTEDAGAYLYQGALADKMKRAQTALQ
jgi:hypothetical protein